MAQRVLAGAPASPGLAVGAARVLDTPAAEAGAETVPEELRAAEAERALSALAAAGREVAALAERLRREGRDDDAELVDTGALIAADPELADAVRRAAEELGLPAAAALSSAAATAAEAIAALPDANLAARADDVLSLGRRAARIAAAETPGRPWPELRKAGDVVLVARDLGPADVSELGPEVRAIALAAGGVTAHAAIVARSRGLPMVVALGDDALRVRDGAEIVVDGSEGIAVCDPEPAVAGPARAATTARADAQERARRTRSLPAVTSDGRRVSVLVNAAGAAEVTAGFEVGAEGVGLLRTELGFLDAPDWPSQQQHEAALRPVFAAAGSRPVVVRVLDFGGDKTPPFLAGDARRGIELLSASPAALDSQLRAILAARGEGEVRVMVPLVRDVADLLLVRERLEAAAAAAGLDAVPALGAMIETREAATAAGSIAAEADFLSIGTNDLASSALGVERYSGAAGPAHHPRVLDLLARTFMGAGRAGVPVEVCGEAASDPVTLPILVGLGVSELSVGAARVGLVRSWIRALAASDARALTGRALNSTSTAGVEEAVGELARELALLESGDAAGQGVDGGGGVVAFGVQG